MFTLIIKLRNLNKSIYMIWNYFININHYVNLYQKKSPPGVYSRRLPPWLCRRQRSVKRAKVIIPFSKSEYRIVAYVWTNMHVWCSLYFQSVACKSTNLNWWKGKPSGSIACTRKQQPRFYWSCSSVVMNDATPLTPPRAWAELHFQM